MEDLTQTEINQLLQALENPNVNMSIETRSKLESILSNVDTNNIENASDISEDSDMLMMRSNFIEIKNAIDGYYYKKKDDGSEIINKIEVISVRKKNNDIVEFTICISDSLYGFARGHWPLTENMLKYIKDNYGMKIL